MRTRHDFRLWVAAAVLAVSIVVGHSASGQQPAIVVTASDPLQAPLLELKPQLERAAGGAVTFTFGTSPTLQRNILDGAPCDVAILPPASITALLGANALGEPVDVGRVGIGVGVRAGTLHPDIRTVDAFRRVLLAATSVTYVQEGASRMSIEQLFEKLGIAGEMKPKTNLRAGYPDMAASVAGGESTLVLIPVSEIPLMNGVENAGTLPPEIQSLIVFQAGATTKSANAAAAAAVLRTLQSPAARGIFQKDGFETP
ncbi:MAG TPA: substrate-binding domain-containing protein [Vicinamibacterales bacterium]|nr:substrate-binding domain-containing protein [Vicinamibacterales bacterium]